MGHDFQINITYDCNLSCVNCIQFVDKISWGSPFQVSFNDLRMAAEVVKDQGISVKTLRISGGEPTIHPEFDDCVSQIKAEWPHKNITVCTNAVVKKQETEGIYYRISDPQKGKFRWHQPPMYSPYDLGIKIEHKSPVLCDLVKNCGSLFDVFGFAPCSKAGTLGRLLRIDPYSTTPIIDGCVNMDMCKHCFCVLDTAKRYEIKHAIKNGKLPHPTKTFEKGLVLDKDNPFIFKTFQQRLESSL